MSMDRQIVPLLRNVYFVQEVQRIYRDLRYSFSHCLSHFVHFSVLNLIALTTR
jgi:hypothetical protein